jgi:hypothetical protein
MGICCNSANRYPESAKTCRLSSGFPAISGEQGGAPERVNEPVLKWKATRARPVTLDVRNFLYLSYDDAFRDRFQPL